MASQSKTADQIAMDASTSINNVKKRLIFESVDHEKWFDQFGLYFARLLASVDYSAEQQEQHLDFLCSNILPSLGPHPQRYHSWLTILGLSVEASVNYVQRGRSPVVRLTLEAINADSGTELDPCNQGPAKEVLGRYKKAGVRDFDTQLYDRFASELTITEVDKIKLKNIGAMDKIWSHATPMQPASLVYEQFLSTQIFSAVEFKSNNAVVKAYALAALKAKASNLPVGQLLFDSLRKVASTMNCSSALTMVNDFMTEINGYNNLTLLSWDNLAPAQSRLKLYHIGASAASWSMLETFWTLNNRVQRPTDSTALGYLRKLWDLLAMVDETSMDHGASQEPVRRFLFNFEMKPGNPVPEPKFYFALHFKNPMQVVTALSWFFNHIGLKKLAASYPAIVKSYFPDGDLSEAVHLFNFVSFAYTEETGVFMSIYYHSSVVTSSSMKQIITSV